MPVTRAEDEKNNSIIFQWKEANGYLGKGKYLDGRHKQPSAPESVQKPKDFDLSQKVHGTALMVVYALSTIFVLYTLNSAYKTVGQWYLGDSSGQDTTEITNNSSHSEHNVVPFPTYD